MKKTTLLFAVILLISVLFHSCRKKDKLLTTTFSGRVYDVTRNKPIVGYPIVVSRVWVCSRGLFANRTCDEIAGSVVTDANGYFTMEFDAMPDGDYVYQNENRPPYRTDLISSSGKIKPGIKNTMNLDAWYPVILRANMNIVNSIYPPLTINAYAGGNSLWNENIYGGPTITKTVYLKAKPNTLNKLIFSYVTSPQANFSHQKPDSFMVNLQDTFDINYNIDCSTF